MSTQHRTVLSSTSHLKVMTTYGPAGVVTEDPLDSSDEVQFFLTALTVSPPP